MKKGFIVILALLVLCGLSFSTPVTSEAKTLTIGLNVPMTGDIP